MDNLLVAGILNALQPASLGVMAIGVVWGIVGGALPGISILTAMALILPFTWYMEPALALILLAGVWAGAAYGGSIPAILIKTPGTASSAVTVIDGYELHLQGKSGKALGISLVCGFVGGIIGTLALIVAIVPLSRIALAFGPPEVFGLALFGLSAAAGLISSKVTKGIISVILGLLLAMVGTDLMTGAPRFHFGQVQLLDGLDLVAVLIGLLALSEVFSQAKQAGGGQRVTGKPSTAFPSLREFRSVMPATFITTIISLIVGVMPAAGGTTAAFISYNEVKRWSKHKELFGKGSLEGVAAAETANNAVQGGDLVPTLAFGIPGSASSALFIVALMMHGIVPGPMLLEKHADIVYTLLTGLVVANVMMLGFGYLLLRPSVWIVSLRPEMIKVATVALLVVGTFSLNYSVFDVFVALVMGIVGYFMMQYGYSPTAAVLGFVLGDLVELNLRRALTMSGGDPSIFFTRPITLAFIVLAVATMAYPFLMDWRERRKRIAREPGTSADELTAVTDR